MGLLRKESDDALGLETVRRVAIRFGYADGYHDAVNLRERSNWTDPVDGVRAGAVPHRLEDDRAHVGAIQGKPQECRRGVEDQHGDALANDEAVRHFLVNVFVSLLNAP